MDNQPKKRRKWHLQARISTFVYTVATLQAFVLYALFIMHAHITFGEKVTIIVKAPDGTPGIEYSGVASPKLYSQLTKQ